MKKFTFSLMMLAIALAANAQILLNETFQGTFTELADATVQSSYTPDASEWSLYGKPTGGTYSRTVTDEPLTYTNAGGEYILSGVGRALENSYGGNGGSPNTGDFVHFREFSSNAVDKVCYLSFLIKFPNSGGTNSVVIGMSNGYSGYANRPNFWRNRNSNNLYFGADASNTNSSKISSSYSWDEIYFIVLKNDMTNKTFDLYVNPDIGNSEPTNSDLQAAANSSQQTTSKFLFFRGQGNTANYFTISGIRITDNWADAVAAKLTAPTLPASAAEQATDLLPDGTGFTANWTPSISDTRADGYIVNVYQEATLVTSETVPGQNTSGKAITGLSEGTYTYEVIATLNDGTYSNSDPALSAASTRSADVVLQGTGIGSSVYGKTVQSVQYTTLTGIAAPTSARGVLLKKTIYADGSVKMEKTVK